MICNLPTHDQERLYNDIAWKLSTGTLTSVAEIINALRVVYPEDEAFKTAFADKELRTTNSHNKRIVRYILFVIEHQRSGQDFDFESASYNLEHILPEYPDASWSHIEEAKQDRLIYRIGNMTPLETKRNRELGNGDYTLKRAVYEQSDFQITRAIAEHYEEWNEQKVEARQKQLAKVAASLWRIDF